MSSDVMIVCKEFNNWEHNRDFINDPSDKASYEEPAVCIGEASMGDVGDENKFAAWFESRYFAGEDMVAQMMNQQIGKSKKERQEFNFQGYVFTRGDLDACISAINELPCPYLETSNDRSRIIRYLEKCVGKHISTENW